MAATFDLSIEALENRRYRVTVTDSPAGTASTEINAPFTFDELADLGDTFSGRAGLNAAELATISKKFGETLFKAIISDGVYYAYTTSQTNTGTAALPIRLRLDRAGDLAGLPWHLMRDAGGGVITISRLDKPIMTAPVGGLREFVRYQPLALLLPIFIIAGVIGVIALTILRPPPDVDLLVTGVRFLPREPAPGQPFKVTITIRNQGTTPSGKFAWEWYRGDPRGSNPDLTGSVENLPGETEITVKGESSFGWWDEYDSTAWVDRLVITADKNTFNNQTRPKQSVIRTSDDPFVIDFNSFPNGDPISTAFNFTGNEFNAWNLSLKPNTANRPECARAVLRLGIVDNVNMVTTGLPTFSATMTPTPTSTPLPATPRPACDDLPMVFTPKEAFGGAQVDFEAITPGVYTLRLLTPDEKPIAPPQFAVVSQTVTAPGLTSLRLPPPDTAILSKSTKAITAVFEGQAKVRLQKLTFYKPLAP